MFFSDYEWISFIVAFKSELRFHHQHVKSLYTHASGSIEIDFEIAKDSQANSNLNVWFTVWSKKQIFQKEKEELTSHT